MKKVATVLLILVCAAAGVIRWLDVVNYTDMATGFVTWGSHLWRYALAGGILLLLALASVSIGRRPEALEAQNKAQGLTAILSGLGFAALGGVYLANWQSLSGFQLVLAALYLVTALWMLLLGRTRFTEEFEAPTQSALVGMAGTLSLYLLTIQRFGLAPTGIVRVNYIFSALAALVALLFCTAQLKVAYVPGGKSGRWVWFSGMAAFLFCTCLALPGTVCGYWVGSEGLMALTESIALGFMGLMGAVYAVTAAGPERPQGESAPATWEVPRH